MLLQYQGALVVVSHDQAFMRALNLSGYLHMLPNQEYDSAR
jgi:ATPase subunit of ABC transporter with duplicated ATPase domains